MRFVQAAMTVVVAMFASRVAHAQDSTTVIHGTIRQAVTRTPIGNVTVVAGISETVTDSAGRFVLRVSRSASKLDVRKEGYLDFQYPILRLSTDSLATDVELRSDPPSPESYARGTFLPILCVIVDAADRLAVFNSCSPASYPVSEYRRQLVKHHPWSLYFGRAGDRGGVLIATRTVGSR